jgi:hypothetical protein
VYASNWTGCGLSITQVKHDEFYTMLACAIAGIMEIMEWPLYHGNQFDVKVKKLNKGCD